MLLRRCCCMLLVTPILLGRAHAQVEAPVTPSAATDTKPLPAIPELLTAVERHEDRDDAAIKQYTYHVHTVTENYDGNDSVKKTETEDAESFTVSGVRVHRLTAKNGKPLTPDEAAKEKDRVDKLIEEGRKKQAKRDQQQASGKPDANFITASRMLELGTFSNERRVELNGRPTIVLDYAGNRDAKTRNSGEKVVQDLVGTVWIDEQDKEIARADGHFNADFKLGFGLLADIHKGLSFSLQKQKINDEVWLTKRVEGQGKASLGVFVVRVHGHSAVEMSDYKKFQTGATILPGSEVIDNNGQPTPDVAPTTPPVLIPATPKP